MGHCRVAAICLVALAACKVPNASRVALDGPVCGNGVIDPGEVCDDGNTIGGDGCSADCTSDETCGNGVIDIGEQCDDGNTIACDGCSADCTSDETCGNGVIDTCKGETCDDGNNRSGDGCSATCQSNESCGNGVVDTAAGEQCDTSGVQTATCETDCKLPKCGDGILNKLAGEECDDGNTTSGDGCDDKCRKEVCGNGRVEDDEQCDDGNTITSDSCVNCKFAVCGDFYVWRYPKPPKEQCDEGPTPSPHGACPSGCKSAYCGDGYLWNLEGGTEQCDTKGVDTTSCNGGTCKTPRCGDCYTNGATGEQCDSCGTDSSNCVGATCRTSYCGDGHINTAAGEQCEDGNTNTNDACINCQNAFCGDGYVYNTGGGTEQCDHAGNNGVDGICDANCQCVNGAPCQ